MIINDNILLNVNNSDIVNGTFEIPASVEEIGSSAFYKCSNLTSITIPASVTSIGNFAFNGCSNLTSITFAENSQLTSIGEAAFDGCDNLSYTVYDNAKYLGNTENPYMVLFRASRGITSCDIHTSTKIIYYGAFFNCSNLLSISIPASVTSVGNEAFHFCNNLTAVYITDIAAWCGISFGNYSANPLYYAHNLYLNGELVTDLVIPEGVTSIGNYAFYKCSKLTSITIPASVTSIGDWAFDDCDNLTYNTYDNAKYLGNATTPYMVLVKATNTDITSCNIHEDTKIIYYEAFYNCSKLTSITIPAGVTSIGDYAFRNCRNLTSPINNYKAFLCEGDKFIARQNYKRYKVGHKSFARGELEPCQNGLHYCTNIFDIFNYYCGEYSKAFVIALCDVSEENIGHDYDSKRCARWIKPTKILSREEVISILNNNLMGD